jgi:hypothetical protein
MSQSVILHIDRGTSTAILVDAIKDALIALKAPLRFRKEKLCWVVMEEGKPKYLTLTSKRLEYFIGKIGARFERANSNGKYESVAAPREALKMFLALTEHHQWFVDEWEEEDEE